MSLFYKGEFFCIFTDRQVQLPKDSFCFLFEAESFVIIDLAVVAPKHSIQIITIALKHFFMAICKIKILRSLDMSLENECSFAVFSNDLFFFSL